MDKIPLPIGEWIIEKAAYSENDDRLALTCYTGKHDEYRGEWQCMYYAIGSSGRFITVNSDTNDYIPAHREITKREYEIIFEVLFEEGME